MEHWLTYIGKQYTANKFIAEARRTDISRNVAPNIAKTLHFKDIVTCLQWRGKTIPPVAFAQFRITRILLDAQVSTEVTTQLEKEGKAVFSGGGGMVSRECGHYVISGGWAVKDIDLSEIAELADAIAKEKKVKTKFMVGGTLSRVIEPAVAVIPAPPFTRGFMRARDWNFEITDEGVIEQTQLLAVTNYAKN